MVPSIVGRVFPHQLTAKSPTGLPDLDYYSLKFSSHVILGCVKLAVRANQNPLLFSTPVLQWRRFLDQMRNLQLCCHIARRQRGGLYILHCNHTCLLHIAEKNLYTQHIVSSLTWMCCQQFPSPEVTFNLGVIQNTTQEKWKISVLSVCKSPHYAQRKTPAP